MIDENSAALELAACMCRHVMLYCLATEEEEVMQENANGPQPVLRKRGEPFTKVGLDRGRSRFLHSTMPLQEAT